MRLLTRCIASVIAVSAVVVAGCGGETVKLVPVEGTLKINGKPAGNVNVQFLPDIMKGSKGPTSFATTAADGTFKLKTYDNRDGAVVGHHNIVLADLDEERPEQGKAATKKPRLDYAMVVPGKGLSAEVKPGQPVVLEATGPR